MRGVWPLSRPARPRTQGRCQDAVFRAAEGSISGSVARQVGEVASKFSSLLDPSTARRIDFPVLGDSDGLQSSRKASCATAELIKRSSCHGHARHLNGQQFCPTRILAEKGYPNPRSGAPLEVVDVGRTVGPPVRTRRRRRRVAFLEGDGGEGGSRSAGCNGRRTGANGGLYFRAICPSAVEDLSPGTTRFSRDRPGQGGGTTTSVQSRLPFRRGANFMFAPSRIG